MLGRVDFIMWRNFLLICNIYIVEEIYYFERIIDYLVKSYRILVREELKCLKFIGIKNFKIIVIILLKGKLFCNIWKKFMSGWFNDILIY